MPSTAAFECNEVVEYFSASKGAWIPAKVVRVNKAGIYDLDCKPNVKAENIRKIVDASVAHPAEGGPMVTHTQDAPVQLLRVEKKGDKWHYEVCAEGAKLLESHGSRRIAVASICGLYRTGKSYILNLLLERVQRGLPLFQVGSTTRACTEGLWLWGSIDSQCESSPLLAFIDCEGFGSTDSDRTRDAQLMTLCALLSSALVLNTRGALNESIFNALALTCRFAEHVEARGNEASRPELIWLLRDFQLDLVDESGCPISPSEYLEQSLRAAPLVGHDAQRGQAAHEVRQSLLRFFNQRRCMTLVRPAVEEEDLQQLASLPYSGLRKEFQVGVEALRTQLVTVCNSSPKTVGGQMIGCSAFVALMRQLVLALNENAILNVRGAWETVQHSACVDLTDELRKQATTTLRKLSAGEQLPGGTHLPMTEMSLNALFRQQRSELRVQWDQRAVGDEAVRREYWQELEEVLEWEETAAQERNIRIADQQLTEACRAWLTWLDDSNSMWNAGEQISEGLICLMERTPSAPLARAAKSAMEAAGRRVARERDANKQVKARLVEADRQAAAFSSASSKQDAADRAKLEEKAAKLDGALEELRQALNAEQSRVRVKDEELKKTAGHNQTMLEDIEVLRALEHELKAQLRSFAEKEVSQQTEIDRLAADVAKAENEKLSSERASRIAHLEAESSSTARQQLQARLDEATTRQQDLGTQLEELRADHASLQIKFEKIRREREAGEGLMRKERDAERAEFKEAQGKLRAAEEEVKSKQRELQEVKTQLQGTMADLEAAKEHQRDEIKRLNRAFADKESSWRENLDWVKAAASKAEADRIASERAARKARWEADTALEERKWLESEVKRLAAGQK